MLWCWIVANSHSLQVSCCYIHGWFHLAITPASPSLTHWLQDWESIEPVCLPFRVKKGFEAPCRPSFSLPLFPLYHSMFKLKHSLPKDSLNVSQVWVLVIRKWWMYIPSLVRWKLFMVLKSKVKKRISLTYPKFTPKKVNLDDKIIRCMIEIAVLKSYTKLQNAISVCDYGLHWEACNLKSCSKSSVYLTLTEPT